MIEVADTGSGLTREECERIFTPYYTSKQHGTGLGLAIVQSVISDHGGRIGVQSETGTGHHIRHRTAGTIPTDAHCDSINRDGECAVDFRYEEERCRPKRIS